MKKIILFFLVILISNTGFALEEYDLLFKHIKTGLSNAEKRQIFSQLDFKLSKDRSHLIYKNVSGDANADAIWAELNRDDTDELIVLWKNIRLPADMSLSIALFVKAETGDWVRQYDMPESNIRFLHTSNKGLLDLMMGYHDSCRIIWQWNGSKYKLKCGVPTKTGACLEQEINPCKDFVAHVPLKAEKNSSKKGVASIVINSSGKRRIYAEVKDKYELIYQLKTSFDANTKFSNFDFYEKGGVLFFQFTGDDSKWTVNYLWEIRPSQSRKVTDYKSNLFFVAKKPASNNYIVSKGINRATSETKQYLSQVIDDTKFVPSVSDVRKWWQSEWKKREQEPEFEERKIYEIQDDFEKVKLASGEIAWLVMVVYQNGAPGRYYNTLLVRPLIKEVRVLEGIGIAKQLGAPYKDGDMLLSTFGWLHMGYMNYVDRIFYIDEWEAKLLLDIDYASNNEQCPGDREGMENETEDKIECADYKVSWEVEENGNSPYLTAYWEKEPFSGTNEEWIIRYQFLDDKFILLK